MFSVYYAGKISRFARNDKLLSIFQRLYRIWGEQKILIDIFFSICADYSRKLQKKLLQQSSQSILPALVLCD